MTLQVAEEFDAYGTLDGVQNNDYSCANDGQYDSSYMGSSYNEEDAQSQENMQDDLNLSPAVIKVFGTGGGGSNAVDRMIAAGLQNIEFIAANTDKQALSRSKAPTKIVLGQKITRGLGAGGKPEVGEKAATEDSAAIARVLENANMVFITAGMGGGTGTGSAPVVAKIAKEIGALTVGVVTTPFNFEGKVKMRLAEEGIEKLRQNVDTLILIPNQNLMDADGANASITDAFKTADDVLRQGVQAISELITKPGLINVDFADACSVMRGKGNAIMGIGSAHGENCGLEAASKAISNPILKDTNIDGAQNVLINITCGPKFKMSSIDEMVKIITKNADPDVNIFTGLVTDEAMEENVTVTVIATGFSGNLGSSSKENKNYISESAVERSSFMSNSEWDATFGKPKTEQPFLMNRNNSSDLDAPTCTRVPNLFGPSKRN